MAYNPINPNGQATMANSEPVVIASDQSAVPVSASSLPLPTGAATAANQTTIIGHVDGIEGLLTTIDADTGGIATSTASIDTKTPALGQALAASSVPVVLTAAQVSTLTPPAAITGFATSTIQTDKSQFTKITDGTDTALVTAAGEQNVLESNSAAIKTAVEILDNAITGNEMQVDVITMPTVTVNAHDVTNAGTFAVQVDGAALTALQLIDDTVFAEDAAHTTADKGIQTLAVRRDTASALGADNDYTPQTTNARAATWVAIEDGAGGQVTSFGGGTEYTEDVATANPIVGKAIMVERDDALSVVTPIEGDNIGLRGTAEGALWTQDFNSDGILADTTAIKTAVEILDNAISGSEMQVDVITMPAVTVTGGSTLAEQQTQTTHLATIAGDTTSIQTAVELLDDTVATLGTTTYTEAATKGLVIGAVRRDADTTLVNTTNEVTPLQVDANGYLKVEVFSGATLPVSVASAQIASGAIASGAIASGAVASGAFASGSIASGAIAAGAIAAGNTSIATTEDTARAAGEHLVKVGLSRLDTPVANANVSGDGDYTNFIADNYGKLWVAGTVPEDTAHVAGEGIAVNGVRRIDTAASSAGTSGDWATMDATAEGAVWAALTPTTTSGCSVFMATSADGSTALTNTAQAIKASAGNLYGYYIYNPNSAATYVHFYNTAAASVTVGTTNPLVTFCIPATSGANLAFPYPVTFSNAGWSISATTTGGGNTAPTTALEAVVFYK